MRQRSKTAGPVCLCLIRYPVKFCGHHSPPLSADDVSLNRASTVPSLPHVHGFPALGVLSMGPTSSQAFALLRVSPIRFAYSLRRPGGISRVPDLSISRHTMPTTPSGSPVTLPIRSPTIAFRQGDVVGPGAFELRGSLSFTFVTVCLSLCLRLVAEAWPAYFAALTASVTGSNPRLNSWWLVRPCQGGGFTHWINRAFLGAPPFSGKGYAPRGRAFGNRVSNGRKF